METSPTSQTGSGTSLNKAESWNPFSLEEQRVIVQAIWEAESEEELTVILNIITPDLRRYLHDRLTASY
jgi:hypothetical protein